MHDDVARFDARAAAWDASPHRRKLARDITAAMEAAGLFRQPVASALDFGCGTGLLTLELAERCQTVTGLDTSPGMLAELAAKIERAGLPNVGVLEADLAAEDQRRIELDVVFLHRFRIARVNLAQHAADVTCGLVHVLYVVQMLAFVLLDAFAQHVHQRLRDGEIAGAHEHHHALAGFLEHRNLAEGADLVDAGIGTGVRQEHHARIQQHAHTVSHRSPPLASRE